MIKNERVKSIIESILFAWGDPIKVGELSKIIEIKESHLRDILLEMEQDYLSESRGIVLKTFGDTYQFKTKDINYDYVAMLFRTNTRSNLSNSALEALSIIAYKQPITKIEMDMIRGVKSDYILRTLMDKDLVETRGKLDKPGKPIIYGTTGHFLAYFGLKSIQDLPPLKITPDSLTGDQEGIFHG
ncbi:MAG: Segregation and condensation protein B [Clostridiales bacterium 38_11]|nr:MAG: Segregation and condensation protein B [Clostridiales bacterium 38_11]